jgi:MHS family proline/betaine transporter-like MFS transporter
VLASFGIVVSGTIFFYVILLCMPTFARTQLHLPLDQAFSAQAINLACMIVLIPILGALSDNIGRKPIMMGALILYFVSIYPLFSWMYANPSFTSLLITQVALCCLMGAFSGSNIDSIGRTISSTRTFDGARNRLQHGLMMIAENTTQ